jgi:phosphate:Na+ symporter
MEEFNIWAFLWGLAMFVFGMDVLESCIHELWYAQLKKFLAKTVNTSIKAIFAGTVLAGILQSGTIVSLMVLSFAGAGILTLTGAIGVIVWANVGGTFLAVIIAKLGFGYSISSFALPLIGTWGILQFFKNKKIKLIGQLILSFGLLLFGIGYLKDSVSILATGLDVAQYANMWWYVFYLGGAVLALLLHSSGTATIIAMTALTAGIISFDQAVIAMLGASIGSSLVSVYASMWWSAVKRNVALTHFGFNTLGAILFLFVVPWTEEFMQLFMKTTGEDGPTAIAWYQVIYNVLTGVLIYPFIGAIARGFERYSSEDKTDYQLVSITNPKDYPVALQQDLLTLIKKIFKFNVHHMDIDQKILLNPEYTVSEKHYAVYHLNQEALDEDYDVLKNVEEGVVKWLLTRIHHGDHKEDEKYLKYYEIIETMMYSAKTLHDTRDDFTILVQSESLMMKERLQYLKEQMVDLYTIVADMIAHRDDGHSDLADILTQVDDNNTEITNLLGQHLHRQNLPGGELSALLHLTSSLHRSHNALVKAIKMMYK